jgi:hypothetical protein
MVLLWKEVFNFFLKKFTCIIRLLGTKFGVMLKQMESLLLGTQFI